MSDTETSQGKSGLETFPAPIHFFKKMIDQYLQFRVCLQIGCIICFRGLQVNSRETSQDWTCLRAEFFSRPDLSKHFDAGLVSGLNLSRGRTCPRTSGPEVFKSSKARRVSRPEKFRAGNVLELVLLNGSRAL